MPKKKAPTNKPPGQIKTNKNIISVQHRQIKHTGKKFDNGFLELRIWLPLWELPLWVFPSESLQSNKELLKVLKTIVAHQVGGSDGE